MLSLHHFLKGVLILKFICKYCNKKHIESNKMHLVVNGISHYPESVNGIKPVFTFSGDYYCDEDCFISYQKQKVL